MSKLSEALKGLDVKIEEKLLGKNAGNKLSYFEKKDRANYIKLANTDLQMKDRLRFMITPTSDGFMSNSQNGAGFMDKTKSFFSDFSLNGGLASTGLSVLGTLVFSLYLQEITFPVSEVFEYDETTRRVKGFTKPDTISFVFLEDERGSVLRYFTMWKKTIMNISSGSFTSYKSQFAFSDNQDASERIGILLLNSGNKRKLSFPRIMFYGLKFKDMGSLTVGFDQKDNLKYTVQCSVKEVATPLI